MKKPLLFALLSCSLSLSSQQFTAGTRYSNSHDVVPDSLLWYRHYPSTYQTYSLSVFGNGPEIQFTAIGSVSPGGSQALIKVQSLHPNVYVLFGRKDSVWVPADQNWYVTDVAKPLVAGEVINAPGAVWLKNEQYLIHLSGSGGGQKNVFDFVGGDKYLGLRFDEVGTYSTTSHYGWIWMRCISDDSCYVKEYSSSTRVSGLGERAGGRVRIYPNPAHNQLYIQSNGNIIEPSTIGLVDVLGNSLAVPISGSGHQFLLDISTLPAGVYFIQYKEAGKTVSQKIIRNN